ncbi:MAG: hypothetical protein CL840_18965 [Crocinitomicaceae bacterium]|nr:hypothetical protein [Crocinitomicaceae bacterium]|tara:strand:+ start:14499 stop:14780 length:282 start_codon:yes stop_codon:yes gene_type:complete
MNSDKKTLSTVYVPIDCSFHDQLLELATFRKEIDIIYMDTKGQNQSIYDRIADVYINKSKEEFLKTNSGLEIRLDRVVKAGDYNNPYESCSID